MPDPMPLIHGRQYDFPALLAQPTCPACDNLVRLRVDERSLQIEAPYQPVYSPDRSLEAQLESILRNIPPAPTFVGQCCRRVFVVTPVQPRLMALVTVTRQEETSREEIPPEVAEEQPQQAAAAVPIPTDGGDALTPES